MFNTTTNQELLDCNYSKAHVFRKEWEQMATQIGARLSSALLLFGALSAYSTSPRTRCKVTKPLHVLDEIKDTMHYWHGCKELGAAHRLGESPGG